jgi:putative DNA primase/helicase
MTYLPPGIVSVGRPVIAMAMRSGVPTVYVNDHDRAAADAWKALRAANEPDDWREFIFRSGDLPCRFERNDHGKLRAVPLNNDRMRYRLNETVNWKRKTQKGATTLDGAPREVVSMVLATPDAPLPLVTRVVEAPILTPKGKVVEEPGYSADGKVFHDPDSRLEVPPVPSKPSRAELERAKRLILGELFGDFPFRTDADRAHAVCLLLQPFVRDLIDGETPLYDADAPTPGSGKGLLIKVCMVVLQDSTPPLTPLPEEEPEWQKLITTLLMESSSIVVFDNANRTISSGAFANVLTSPMWKNRILGTNRVATLPNRVTWVVTGNNVSMSSELLRRTVRIVIDTGREHPEDRPAHDFKHPDLVRWAREHRGELIWAALVLARNWIAKGRPPGRETMGSFESWAKVMGGILRAAGIPGLLTNREEQRAAGSSERDQMIAFLDAWYAAHGAERKKASEVDPEAWKLLGIDAWHERAAVAMGFRLRQYADSPFNGLVLRRAKREDGSLATKGGSGLWYVEPSAAASPAPLEPEPSSPPAGRG